MSTKKSTKKAAAKPERREWKSIESPTARAGLVPRRAPFWQRLRAGHFVGYRITPKGKVGHWLAKREQGGKCLITPMGTLDTTPDGKQFEVATALAEDWFKTLEKDGHAAPVQAHRVTLADAIREYLLACAAERPSDKPDPEQWAKDKARTANRFFEMLVVPFKDESGEKWIDVPIAKLRPQHFQQWRRWVQTIPMSTKKGHGKNGESRTAATVNRYMVPLRAALNLAKRTHRDEHGQVVIVDTWAEALARDLKADKSRSSEWIIVKKPQRAKMRKVAEPALVPFLQAHEIAPVRPGAWAAMRVRDYDADAHRVYVPFDKAGAGRYVLLPQDAACKKLFRDLTRGRSASAPLFVSSTGKAWNANSWNDSFKAAASAAGLPDELTLYSYRHTRITELIDSKVVSIGTVAKVAGTSVAQIEKHYHHLTDEVARQALAGY